MSFDPAEWGTVADWVAGLGVPGHQVVDSRLIGGRASEGGVSPFLVVVLEPWLQGLAALVVAGEHLVVGPFGLGGSG